MLALLMISLLCTEQHFIFTSSHMQVMIQSWGIASHEPHLLSNKKYRQGCLKGFLVRKAWKLMKHVSFRKETGLCKGIPDFPVTFTVPRIEEPLTALSLEFHKPHINPDGIKRVKIKLPNIIQIMLDAMIKLQFLREEYMARIPKILKNCHRMQKRKSFLSKFITTNLHYINEILWEAGKVRIFICD